MDTNFDRAKIFYPYVMNYIATLHGLHDLISRKCNKWVQKLKDKNPNWDEYVDNLPFDDKLKSFVKSSKLETTSLLMGNLTLKSQQYNNNIFFDIDEIADEFSMQYEYLLPFQLKAAGVLLIMCYEYTKVEYDNKDAIWNFLYHCRNAVAHGGFFNITNFKRFPAKWGALEITINMNGTNLFKNNKNIGLLSPGDPIYLLHEIEKLYIK